MLKPKSVKLNKPDKKLRISNISQELGLTADTLRYYEKIGLLPRITRATKHGCPIVETLEKPK